MREPRVDPLRDGRNTLERSVGTAEEAIVVELGAIVDIAE